MDNETRNDLLRKLFTIAIFGGGMALLGFTYGWQLPVGIFLILWGNNIDRTKGNKR